jgi:hypothetical protein
MENICIRNMQPGDCSRIIELARRVYPGSDWWQPGVLESHFEQFPQGQFVAVDQFGFVRGMIANLIVQWHDFTKSGMPARHDPAHGRTLLGEELMLDPQSDGYKVGYQLCRARRELAYRSGLLWIRAIVPLHVFADFQHELRPADYVQKVERLELDDMALSFHLRWGFTIVGVSGAHLHHDPSSLGWSALLEWRNPEWSPYYVRMARAIRGAGHRLHTHLAA